MAAKLNGYRLSMDGSLVDPAGCIVPTDDALALLAGVNTAAAKRWSEIIRSYAVDTKRLYRQRHLGSEGYHNRRQ